MGPPRVTTRPPNALRARAAAELARIAAEVVGCERCPRLRAHCASVAREKRRAYRDWEYWGGPVPGWPLVLASYHPSRQNTNTGTLTRAMWRAIFRRAAEFVRQ